MRVILTACFFVCMLLPANAQQQYKFRVYLKDKGTHAYSIKAPEKFLSEKSIDRKKNQNICIDETDFPISDDYMKNISHEGAVIVSQSKWFNTVTVQLEDSAQIDNIVRLAFVDSVKYVWRGINREEREFARPRLEFKETIDSLHGFFGQTFPQFTLHNAASMFMSGFTGKGIDVAVIDAGFTNVDVIPEFETANIAGFKSFIPQGKVFLSSDHGTKVLSTLAINLREEMMGSAPLSEYYLLQSEDVISEFPVEEDYWVRAVEYADSLGIDIINSSLGYSSFDDSTLNYVHNDLDARTSFMSKAADKAYEKGMLLVISAGNEGNKAWEKISVPGDAVNVLTVGAIALDSLIAPFSSKGNTTDNRIKPDVVSIGKGTVTINQYGEIDYSNGTSFSSPFMTGLIASLWSVNKNMNRNEVMQIIKESSHKFNNPDSIYGYGIPNFDIALQKALVTLPIYHDNVFEDGYRIEKNKNSFKLSFVPSDFFSDNYEVFLLDERGGLITQHSFQDTEFEINFENKLARSSQYLYLVIRSFFFQKTYRFKM